MHFSDIFSCILFQKLNAISLVKDAMKIVLLRMRDSGLLDFDVVFLCSVIGAPDFVQ